MKISKEKLIIIENGIFSSIISVIFLLYIKYLSLSSIYYSLYVSISYLSPLLSSLFFGNIEINRKNYVMISLIGVFGPLASLLLIYFYRNPIIYIISMFLFYFTYYATYYAIIRYNKDVKYNYDFTLYWTIGLFISLPIYYIINNLNEIMFIISILYIFASIFLIINLIKILIRSIIESIKEELGLFYYLEKFFDGIENVEEHYEYYLNKIPALKISKIKFGYLEFYNFLLLVGFSIVWTQIINYTSIFNLNYYYPIFLFLNGIFSAILYKYFPKSFNYGIIQIGILLRILMAVVLLLTIKSNSFIMILIDYIIAAFSWIAFQYIFDNIILNKSYERFGSVYFFRYLGGTIGPFIINIIGNILSIYIAIILLIILLPINLYKNLFKL